MNFTRFQELYLRSLYKYVIILNQLGNYYYNIVRFISKEFAVQVQDLIRSLLYMQHFLPSVSALLAC